MTTEKYCAYALEEGDQIVLGDNIYRILRATPMVEGYRLMLVDEDSMTHSIDCDDSKEFRVLCDV